MLLLYNDVIVTNSFECCKNVHAAVISIYYVKVAIFFFLNNIISDIYNPNCCFTDITTVFNEFNMIIGVFMEK